MRGIFISYRRDDTAAHAGRLYDRLAAHFGAQRVFRDVDSLHPGAEFAAVIEERVAACDALVVLIGNNWLNAADAQGKRKLDQPYDYVRTEIGAALRQRKLVIPALVDGATLPQASELPAEIAALRSRNSLEISERHFAADVQRIIEALDPASARVEPGGNAPPAASPSGFWAWLKNGDNQRTLSFIGAGVAAVAAATWTLYSHFSPPVIPDKPVAPPPRRLKARTAKTVPSQRQQLTNRLNSIPPPRHQALHLGSTPSPETKASRLTLLTTLMSACADLRPLSPQPGQRPKQQPNRTNPRLLRPSIRKARRPKTRRQVRTASPSTPQKVPR